MCVRVGTKLSEISAIVTDPSGVKDRCDIADDSPGVYQVLFKPRETGLHSIAVSHQLRPVPGSLISYLSVSVCGLSVCVCVCVCLCVCLLV